MKVRRKFERFDCLKPSCGHKVNLFVFQTFVALTHSPAVYSEANG